MPTKPSSGRSPIAMWGQIAREIERKIEGREWLPGSKLPSELELAALFNVSRLTVRQALGALAADGYIERIHGSGTFVSKSMEVLQHDLGIAQPWRERLQAEGSEGKSEQLGPFRESPPPAALLHAVGLNEEHLSKRMIMRIQMVKGSPIGLSESWLGPKIPDEITDAPLAEGSLSTTLRQRLGLVSAQVDSYIHAENAGNDVVPLLKCKPETALIVVSDVTFDSGGEIISCSRTRWLGNRVRFHQLTTLL